MISYRQFSFFCKWRHLLGEEWCIDHHYYSTYFSNYFRYFGRIFFSLFWEKNLCVRNIWQMRWSSCSCSYRVLMQWSRREAKRWKTQQELDRVTIITHSTPKITVDRILKRFSFDKLDKVDLLKKEGKGENSSPIIKMGIEYCNFVLSSQLGWNSPKKGP